MSEEPRQARIRRRCNELDGRRWLQNSISVWSDIRKTPDEARLGHPALFPQMLVERLIETFLPPAGRVVLDPFAGAGSTVVTATRLGRQGIGLELSPEYATLANHRLRQQAERLLSPPLPSPPIDKGEPPLSPPLAKGGPGGVTSAPEISGAQQTPPNPPFGRGGTKAAPPSAGGEQDQGGEQETVPSVVHHAPAGELLMRVAAGSVDLCITSPPYWNILNQRRTADRKSVRHYGNLDGDLGRIADYDGFLAALTNVFADVLTVLRPGAYCCIVVMDLRKKDRFYPLHSDLATRLVAAGYRYDDLIVWNRQSEYNHLRPLGYPCVFRVNKVHEFILLMQKPRREVS